MDERGQDFYQIVSEYSGTDGALSPPSFCAQTPGRVAAENTVNTASEPSFNPRRTGNHSGAGYVTSQFRNSTGSHLRLFNAVSRIDCDQRRSACLYSRRKME